MRKIIVLSFITLDGVMQAPGGPEEDTSDGFKYGGWTALYGDEVSGKVMEKQMKPAAFTLTESLVTPGGVIIAITSEPEKSRQVLLELKEKKNEKK